MAARRKIQKRPYKRGEKFNRRIHIDQRVRAPPSMMTEISKREGGNEPVSFDPHNRKLPRGAVAVTRYQLNPKQVREWLSRPAMERYKPGIPLGWMEQHFAVNPRTGRSSKFKIMTRSRRQVETAYPPKRRRRK